MKRFTLLLGIVFLIGLSCSAGNNKPEGNTEGQKSIKLNGAEFMVKVFNYKTDTVWRYLGDKPAIIDFYADWCGPCKIAAPILERIAKKYEGQIYVYKVNTDQERELSQVFRIQGIPAFLIIPQKGMPQMSSGIGRSEEETYQMFERMVQEILLKKE